MCMQDLAFETANLETEMESCSGMSDEENESFPTYAKSTHFRSSLVDYANRVNDNETTRSCYCNATWNYLSLAGFCHCQKKNAILSEVNEAKQIFNLKIKENKSRDISNVFNLLLFQRLLVDVKNPCPTITAVLETLVLTYNAWRNVLKTENMKMKAAIHLLASMIDIRDQHCKNDIPLLFGLLCICYGAGPSMIQMLQCIGLSESFPTLYVKKYFSIVPLISCSA